MKSTNGWEMKQRKNEEKKQRDVPIWQEFCNELLTKTTMEIVEREIEGKWRIYRRKSLNNVEAGCIGARENKKENDQNKKWNILRFL